jgi:hypothetical protein
VKYGRSVDMPKAVDRGGQVLWYRGMAIEVEGVRGRQSGSSEESLNEQPSRHPRNWHRISYSRV